jgi:purine-binding chemotaxis protein CheW
MILTFFAADTIFGIDAGGVIEVGAMSSCLRVPGSPDYIRGVINKFGEIIPLIDFRKKKGAEAEANMNEKRAGIIYVVSNGAKAGLIVDEIKALLPDAEAGEFIRIITAEDIFKPKFAQNFLQ